MNWLGGCGYFRELQQSVIPKAGFITSILLEGFIMQTWRVNFLLVGWHKRASASLMCNSVIGQPHQAAGAELAITCTNTSRRQARA
jgi:hypothetical protein